MPWLTGRSGYMYQGSHQASREQQQPQKHVAGGYARLQVTLQVAGILGTSVWQRVNSKGSCPTDPTSPLARTETHHVCNRHEHSWADEPEQLVPAELVNVDILLDCDRC